MPQEYVSVKIKKEVDELLRTLKQKEGINKTTAIELALKERYGHLLKGGN